MKCYSEIAVWRKMCWSTYKKLQLIWKYCQNVEQQQHYSVYCSLSASKKFLWTIVKAFTRHYSSWCTWERDDIQYFFWGDWKYFLCQNPNMVMGGRGWCGAHFNIFPGKNDISKINKLTDEVEPRMEIYFKSIFNRQIKGNSSCPFSVIDS